jgi:thioredoxin reductase (NADPH)
LRAIFELTGARRGTTCGQNWGMEEFDVVVVGAGAAGLAAGLTLARALRSVVLFDGGETRNARADHSHGILGFEGVSPAALAAQSRAEVEYFGGTIRGEEIIDATREPEGHFIVTTTAGIQVSGRQVLIACGVQDEIPSVPGVRQLWGDRVAICPYCDGWEARGSRVAILGTGPKSIFQAHLLRQWSNRVTLFTNAYVSLDADDFARLAARGIAVVNGTVDAVRPEDEGLALVVGEASYENDIVFTAPRPLPDNRVLTALGADLASTAAGRFPIVDGRGATSVAGLWAAGNSVNPSLKYSTALGAGMDTATHINETLVEIDIVDTMRRSNDLSSH